MSLIGAVDQDAGDFLTNTEGVYSVAKIYSI